MLSLRMIDGMDADAFVRTTGYDPFALFAEPIARHAAAGLLVAENNRIRLTRAGLCVADAIMADFLDPPEPAMVNVGSTKPESPRPGSGWPASLPETRRRQSITGLADPTTFVPSGFSISIHHMTFSGSGSGAVAWMS